MSRADVDPQPDFSDASQPAEVLDEDVFTVPGQNFALVSFVGPNQRQKNDKFGMKIRGVFGTREQADAHIRKIRTFDKIFDVFLVDLYKWVLIPPPSNPLELEHADVEYDQQFLQDLIGGYRKNQQLAREHFLERKQLIMSEGLDRHLDPEERLPPPPPDATAANVSAIFESEDPFLAAKERAARGEPAPEPRSQS